MVVMLLTLIIFTISRPIPSPPHSFITGLDVPFLLILPTVAFLFFVKTDSTDSPDCLPILLSISVFHFLVFFLLSTFQLLVPCGRLSWLMSAFERTLKQHLVSYRIEGLAMYAPWRTLMTTATGSGSKRSSMNASSVPVTASVTFRLLREPGLVVSSPASSADSACTDSSSRSSSKIL